MNNENEKIKSDSKKKKYLVGIIGICLLVVIIFLVYKFKFNENNKRELIYKEISTKEENTTILKVDTWLSIGFMGYVVKTDQKDIFEENELIKVAFDNDVEVVYANGEKFVYHEEEPNAEECYIKPGSIVQVKFHSYGTKEENEENRIEAEKVIENGK